MAKGSDQAEALRSALRQRYPQYRRSEIKRLAELILVAIAEAVAAGGHITFLDTDEFGRVQLDMLVVAESHPRG